MKTKMTLSVVITTVLIAAAARGAEPKLVEPSEVPTGLQKSITLAKGAEAKFFRYDSDSPKVMWRIEIQAQKGKTAWLVEILETVNEGKTNVSVIKGDKIPPKK
jgi:hypothetical protein